ncbi:MAG TPA: hypothetical protein VK915_04420 [Gaiellaceae bacterium]|nr:hypothetical protein [Gaiellaceae bacterium]
MARSRRTYAVVWRDPSGVSQPGRLVVGAKALRFEGGRGRLSARTLAYTDVSRARVAALAERVGGRPTLVLERRAGRPPVRIAGVGGPGVLSELLDRLTPLVAAADPTPG